MAKRLCDYQPPADLLAGHVILVTGAAEGIGRAVASSYAEHGATVIMLDRKRRKLETLYDHICQNQWPEPVLLVQELTQANDETCQQIALGIAHDFGRLDGLLHNAARVESLAPLASYPWQEWQAVIKVNLEAPYLLTRAVFALLKASESASVVFTSADVGRHARAYWGAYAVAYYGVEGLARVWAAETEENTAIRFNTLDPGTVRTNLRKRLYPGEDPGRWPEPERVIPAYLYLMGKDSREITGMMLSTQTALNTVP